MRAWRIGRGGLLPGRLSSKRRSRQGLPDSLTVEWWPGLRRPAMLVSFEGWNDAGEAASFATSYLAKSWGAVPFAEIDPEEFFDFTEARPEVTMGDGRTRSLTWPSTVVSVAGMPGTGRDLVIVRGHEPHLRWKTYCAAVIELARRLGVTEVVTLGAYLAEITHDRDVPVNAAASSGAILDEHGLAASAYEGPTGIVGVLGLALASSGVRSTSLWASVPCYSLPVSPKAASALVRAVGRMLGSEPTTTELDELTRDYERRMDELVREDENVAAYVARIQELEEAVGSELSAEGLAEEVERYLRDKRAR